MFTRKTSRMASQTQDSEWKTVTRKKKKMKGNDDSLTPECIMNLAVLAVKTVKRLSREQNKMKKSSVKQTGKKADEKKADEKKADEKKVSVKSEKKKNVVEYVFEQEYDESDGPYFYDRHCSCGADFSESCVDDITGEMYDQTRCPVCGAW